MPIIRTVSGSVNLLKQNAKTHFFHAPRKGGKEVFLDKAATGATHLVSRAGSASFADSIPGTDASIGGRMITQQFEVAEGEIIKCFVNIHRSYGKLPLSASIFLRVREKAAYRRLVFKMIDHSDTIFNESSIEGCLDHLTVEEAIAAGAHVPRAYRSFSRKENVDTVIKEDIVIRPEEEPRLILTEKVVKDDEGNERIVRTRRRRRRLG